MVFQVSPGSVEHFSADVARLGRAIESARGPEQRDGEQEPPDPLWLQLEAAHEELRVADEELRVQQDEIEGLVASEHLREWQHERLLAALPSPAVLTDVDGVMQSINASAAAMLAVPGSRLVGRPLLSYVELGERPAVRRALSDVVKGDGELSTSITFTPRRQSPVSRDAVLVRRHSLAGVPQVTWILFTTASPASDRGALAEAILGLTQLPLQHGRRRSVLTEAAQICQSAFGDDAVVSLTVGPPVEPEMVATTSKLAQSIDGAQTVAGEGPCQDAWAARSTVYSHDLRQDERWPKLAALLHDTDITWTLASPVPAQDRLVGALNVYGRASEFAAARRTEAEFLAAAVAAVLFELDLKAELETTARNLEVGLTSRAVIDQAKGIIMARERCDADEAFRRLVRASTRQNRKLRELAAELVQATSRRST